MSEWFDDFPTASNDWDKAAIMKTLRGPRSFLRRLSEENIDSKLLKTGEDIKDMIFSEIISRVPHDSGELERSIHVELEPDGKKRWAITVSADARKPGYEYFNYALAVEKGTGRFGPEGQDIEYDEPVVFYWMKRGQARPASEGWKPGKNTRSVIRGQRPQNYIRRGWRAAMTKARRDLADKLGNI